MEYSGERSGAPDYGPGPGGPPPGYWSGGQTPQGGGGGGTNPRVRIESSTNPGNPGSVIVTITLPSGMRISIEIYP